MERETGSWGVWEQEEKPNLEASGYRERVDRTL